MRDSRCLPEPAVSVVIDEATPADVPTLLTLIGELADFERLAHELSVTVGSLEDALFGPRRVAEAVLARAAGEVAGFAVYYRSFSTFAGREGLFLEDLYVRPAFRGQGIGRGLLMHVAAVAARRGCSRLEWAVLNWNRRAVGFYEALGARPVDDWTIYRLDRAALGAIRDQPTAG
jgi:GNAT superfamily N-acetyltransferase